jgi:hypothetical protein
MENLTAYDLLPIGTSKAEIEFRIRAGLCAGCGMAHRVPGEILCSHCCEERDNQLMQNQWKAWGIAA